MKLFTRLFTTLDATNRTNEKVAALEAYFRAAAPADAAWALHFLCGRKVPRAMTSTQFRELAREESGLPTWLFDECYDAVGDLAETVALLLPASTSTIDLPLNELIAQRLLAMHAATETTRRRIFCD